MEKCLRCGNPVRDSAEHCPDCRRQLRALADEAAGGSLIDTVRRRSRFGLAGSALILIVLLVQFGVITASLLTSVPGRNYFLLIWWVYFLGLLIFIPVFNFKAPGLASLHPESPDVRTIRGFVISYLLVVTLLLVFRLIAILWVLAFGGGWEEAFGEGGSISFLFLLGMTSFVAAFAKQLMLRFSGRFRGMIGIYQEGAAAVNEYASNPDYVRIVASLTAGLSLGYIAIRLFLDDYFSFYNLFVLAVMVISFGMFLNGINNMTGIED